MAVTVVVGLLFLLGVTHGVEHNLPEGVELVDPKDLGLNSQIDLDKLLGNVKALPIDGNAISSALGKTGLKTQVLTVGFDGNEGINLDDFELPQLKNDEHGPLAQAAFSSFKNFFKNSSSANPVTDAGNANAKLQEVAPPRPGRKKMMRRRKIVKVNGSTTTTTTPTPVAGPKVIELDSSQIEKLIASGKIGPPKSLTPGGPQIIELGQRDLDALLSGENGDEIKQILEGGDTVKDFDLSQITTSAKSPTSSRFAESIPSASVTKNENISTPPVTVEESPATTPIPQQVQYTTQRETVTSQPTTPPPSLSSQASLQDDTTNLPIIYQFNSNNAQQSQSFGPSQSQVPLLSYTGSVNGQQQNQFVRHPTFEFISAPPVSFSSSVLPPSSGVNNQMISVQLPSPQLYFQSQPQQPQQQPQQLNFRNTFISPQPSSNFIPVNAPPQQTASPSPSKPDSTVNNVFPASQQSSQTEQVKQPPSQNNYIQTLHKVNLPQNSVKLVTPSPQVVQSLLNQVPNSFQPSISPNHVVSSPVLDPMRLNSQSIFLNGGGSSPSSNNPPQPFRNTQLFSTGAVAPVRTSSSPLFRFPTVSSSSSSPNGPNRFRTAESSNPFFQQGNLVLNSFVAGDGLNFRKSSNQDFRAPGI